MTEQLKPMTAHRAIYFMERFKKEEKLLGPNEQAAVDFVIAMLEAQPAQAGHLHQALTDPENQPNQYGVEFFMHGPKFAFKVGTQQFTLDYEPTEPGEFEFMQAALIYAFSVFTPDVKTAQAVPVLTGEEISDIAMQSGAYDEQLLAFAHAIEQAVRAKLGAVPAPPEDWGVFNGGAEVANGLSWAEAREYLTPDRLARGWGAVCVADRGNLIGIVGKEGA